MNDENENLLPTGSIVPVSIFVVGDVAVFVRFGSSLAIAANKIFGHWRREDFGNGAEDGLTMFYKSIIILVV